MKRCAVMLLALLLVALCGCETAPTETSASARSAVSDRVLSDVPPPVMTAEDLAGSQGLLTDRAYDDINGWDGYVVTGLGECEDAVVTVPAAAELFPGEYLPYLWDNLNGFRGMERVTAVVLPEGALEVRSGFGYSPALQRVTLPASLRAVGSGIFTDCPALQEVIYGGTLADWQAVEKPDDWAAGAPAFTLRCTDGEQTVAGS